VNGAFTPRRDSNGSADAPKETAIDGDDESNEKVFLGDEEYEPGLLLDSDEESQVIKTPAKAARKARGAKIKARGKYREKEMNEDDD